MRAQTTATRRIGQFFGDALLGLALFALMAGLFGDAGRARAEPGKAEAASAYRVAPPSDATKGFVVGLISQSSAEPLVSAGYLTARPASAPRQTVQTQAFTVLAIVFSALFALNLGFWRHVRRTYIIAGPREHGASR